MGRSEGKGAACSLLFAVTCLVALPAQGQGAEPVAPGVTPGLPGPLAVSVTVGVSRPAESVFRDVYGSPVVPLAGQVDWRIGTSGLGLFGGVRWVTAAGVAVAEGGPRPSDERVEFSMLSWRVGPSWGARRGAWGFGVGGGLAYNSYREEWETAGLLVEDSGPGALVQGAVERAITRRLSALLRVEYAWFEADAPEDTGLGSVGLGGIDLAGGLAFRF